MAPLRIGVLIVPPIQLLDIAPVDLFSMATRSYLEACKLPQPVLDIAIPDADLSIIYISQTSISPVATTARLGLHIDCATDDPKVAPGKLDLLVIPGPPPGLRPEEPVLQYIRDQVAGGVELMTICSGIFVAGFSGVLDGKRATGTRGVQDMLQKGFPKVKWEDKRYANDGKIWTSGGITNGMDMVAWYMKQKLPRALADLVIEMADVEIRPQEYNKGKVAFNAWFVWYILKAWLRGLTKSKNV